MRILVRTSKWAVWARRFGALALPLAILPVLLHRAHLITSDNFLAVEAAAMGLAAVAVAMALIAFVRLWYTGDRGWGRAVMAFLFGVLCLTPAAYFSWLASTIPASSDVSTDFSDSPPLVNFVESRFIGPEERARIEAAYPNARSRTYPIEAPQMFEVVGRLVEAQGWDVRATRAPIGPLGTGYYNASVTTLLGFSQEVALRVVGSAEGATVDMRSASLSTFPDFGENGQRVEAFLLELDNEVTLMLRNAPAQPAVAED
ncbi:MAG TPA: DUF1499 domain-containing protein [Devosia sp.]|jgi:heme/copper-type cytochrome/quinol oxidase subunit 4|nr:DUF1499 domain-containing protein [Devosia sp.]